jgi:DNA-binding CsgD family transcriptional regulator
MVQGPPPPGTARSEPVPPGALRTSLKDSRIRELIGSAVSGLHVAHWIFGVSNRNQELVEFVASDGLSDVRVALDLMTSAPCETPRQRAFLDIAEVSTLPAWRGFGVTCLEVRGEHHSAKLILIAARKDGVETYARTLMSARGPLRSLLNELQLDKPAPRGNPGRRARRTPAPALFVLDRELRIQSMSQLEDIGSLVMAALIFPVEGRLPKFLEVTIRRLIAEWHPTKPSLCHARASVPIPGLFLRVVPIVKDESYLIAVLVEPHRSRRSVQSAAARFNISPREREVIDLMFLGYTAEEVASTLHIAQSTVHDHVKRLIMKTRSHNRIEMAAKLLGWPLTEEPASMDV